MAPVKPKIFRLLARFAGFTAMAVVLAGCPSRPTVDLAPSKVPPDKTVVTVNGEPISLEEFDTEFRLMQIYYSAVSEGDMRAIKRRLFEQVINRRLLVQEARRIGLTMTQEEAAQAFKEAQKDGLDDLRAILRAHGVNENAWKRKLLQERLVSKLVDQEVNHKVQITPAEVEDYYWSHLSHFWRPAAVRARHLIVQKKGDLQKVLTSLKKGEDFAKLATIFSVDLERSEGGDWGFMETDRIPSSYLKVISALSPGEVSKPLKDAFGYHLFQLIGWRPRKMQSFPEVKDAIHDSLLKEEQDLQFDQWMADLKKKSMIKVNEEMAPVVGVALEGSREE